MRAPANENRLLKGNLIHRRFQTWACDTPDVDAVKFGQCALAYAQLNRRANQIAHYLGSFRVGPDTLVAVMFERGLDMMSHIRCA